MALRPALGWAALALAAATWIVFHPAFNRVFVLDQIWYFAELRGRADLGSGLRLADYAAARQYWKGDDALFRPLLFAWLALANRLFTYHHVWWNAATVSLHALVALGLFGLLSAIRRSWWALAVSVLFVVLKPPLELAVWNHLGGYLLGCVALTVAVRAFVRLTTGDDAGPRDRLVYVVAFTAACLFYEALVPIALLAAILIPAAGWGRRRDRRAARLAFSIAPVVTFVLFYAWHVTRVERLLYVDRPDVHGILDAANLLRVVPSSLAALARWSVEAAVPSALTFSPTVFNRLGSSLTLSAGSLPQILEAALSLGTLALIASTTSRDRLRRAWPVMALAAGGAAGYAAVLCLGRPPQEVAAIGYYRYVFCLLLAVFLYALVDFDRVRGWTAGAARAAAAALIVVHGSQTRAVAHEIGRVNQEASTYLARVGAFVDRHRSEPGFSFAIPDRFPAVDPDIVLRGGYPDDPAAPTTVLPLTRILFSRYYDDQHPRYLFGRAP